MVKNIVASNNDKIKQGDLLVLLEDIELKQSFIMDDVKEVFNKKRFLSSLDAAIKYSKISISKDVYIIF